MSKKNNLSRRKKQYEFDLRREQEEKAKRAMKLSAKKNKMKCEEILAAKINAKGRHRVDAGSKKKKGAGGFQVGKKKVKTKLTALAKAKAAQAMEIEK